jgi:sodium-dependent dicarboxylate transporter 2/3/5
MPVMSGEQVLKELKHYRPEIQVVMLTGQGSVESAMEAGRLEAYTYLEKPCELEDLIKIVESARRDRVRVMAKQEIPMIAKGSAIKWLWGSHNYRPGIMILGVLLFLTLILMPNPQTMMDILSFQKTGERSDPIYGYASYPKLKVGEDIATYYSRTFKLGHEVEDENGNKKKIELNPEEVAFRAKVMLGILVVAALFWAFGALPIGITALLVAVCMYFLKIFQPDDIAQAYAKDAVIFVFGVLVVAQAISKTGLDRRIGLLLLGSSNSLGKLLFIFLPITAITCSFMSEHAIVAFIMPIIILVYASACREAGVEEDKALAVMLVLSLCFAANCGGPGSPAAGGRNAVMVGILAEYGCAPSFGQWIKYGLPFVPVMSWVIALYFYLVLYRKVKSRNVNVSSLVRQAANKIGPMNKKEIATAVVMVILIALWINTSEEKGMGGPVLLAIILLSLIRVISWRDIAKIQWEVVALYACACAMGKGLASSGAALFIADGFIRLMPDFMTHGEGLAICASLFTGITTNFMSDGATVSAIGPITVPMAFIANTSPWMVGYATAFASSFAHTLLIGTPNNAIAYTMAKDPVTGEQLVTIGDFIKHGFIILILSFAVLWGWAIFGYWQWLGFPI